MGVQSRERAVLTGALLRAAPPELPLTTDCVSSGGSGDSGLQGRGHSGLAVGREGVK